MAQHPILVANTLLHLSETYRYGNEFEKAQSAAREALSILSKVHPDKDDPEIANADVELDAAIFAEYHAAKEAGNVTPEILQKSKEAANAAKQAMEISLATDGPTQRTRQTQEWLSSNLKELGAAKEAEDLKKLVDK